MTAELVKKWLITETYYEEFGHLNSSCIRESSTVLFLSSSRDKCTLLWQNSVTDDSVGFRPPCLCPSEGHKHGVSMKNCGDLILGAVVYIAIIYHIPDSWIYLLNSYDFYFDHMTGETENWIYSLVKNKSVKLPFVTKKRSPYISVQQEQNNCYLLLLM